MYTRKTAPKVKGGRVQKKNNHKITAANGYVVDRVRPCEGFKHVISKRDIHNFISLIEDWHDIGAGISEIILDEGGDDFDGLYQHYYSENTSTIWLSAWPIEMWVDFDEDYFQEHQWLFDHFGVRYENKKKAWHCYFTKNQAKAFMLLHIFLHELGHHVDKLNSGKAQSGEDYAEDFANRKFYEIWPSYIAHFGDPGH